MAKKTPAFILLTNAKTGHDMTIAVKSIRFTSGVEPVMHPDYSYEHNSDVMLDGDLLLAIHQTPQMIRTKLGETDAF